MDFLHLYNSFLLPITKAKNSWFINPIHLLQYGDILKIPGYNAHCESIEKNTYLRLCCLICQKYLPTLTFLANHKHLMHSTTREQPRKQWIHLLTIFLFFHLNKKDHIMKWNLNQELIIQVENEYKRHVCNLQ